MTTQLFVDGKPLRLGKLVGKGGEGEVYEVADRPGHAFKLYGKPDRQREAKVSAMIGGNLAAGSDLIAFPAEIARRGDGAFAGFVMRLVKNHTSLHELYAPGSRKIHFPKADFRFTVRAAANIARSVAKVHELGAVIGDINHSGILISDQAVAALIDADSFQFGTNHLCRVGVPEYTPPELQGQRLDGVVRSANHDAFGLAVIVFQLLFMGRHPFMGRYAKGDMPIERAISEYRFAYSTVQLVGMTPPPGACRLADFPDYIGSAFEAAFAPNAVGRPTANDWVGLLKNLEGALTKCSANTMHFYPSAASQCTWCRMEQQIGILLFLPAYDFGGTPNISDPGAAGFNLGAIWAAIENVQLPDPSSLQPTVQTVTVEPSKDAKDFKGEQSGRKLVGFLAIGAAIWLLASFPAAWFIYVPAAWFGISRAFSTESNAGKFTGRYKQAEADWHAALDSWRNRIGLTELHQLRASLQQAKNDLQHLPKDEVRRIAEHESNRRDTQLHAFLETFPIRRATIRGIGPAKVAALSSYGIDTAADVVLSRIVTVPGFGSTSAQPLIQWRQRIAARFVFRAQPSQGEMLEVQRIRQSSASKAAQYRTALLKGASDLQRAAATLGARSKVPDPAIARANEGRERARVDLNYLGVTPPVVTIPAPSRPAPTVTRPSSAPYRPSPAAVPSASSSTSCPSCGGRMVRRKARRGRNAGGYFWGCAAYPRCHGTRSI